MTSDLLRLSSALMIAEIRGFYASSKPIAYERPAGHSAPRALLGSIDVARRAGNSVADSTQPNTSAPADANVAGSELVTP